MRDLPSRDSATSVGALITLAAMAATAAIALTLSSTVEIVQTRPLDALAFVVLALALQLSSVQVYGRGHIGVSAIGILAAGFALGPGPALVIAGATAVVQWMRTRRLLHRGLFDASNFALSGGAAALVYQLLGTLDSSTPARVGAALVAGLVYNAINAGLVCVAMSLSESTPLATIWNERFRWARFHYLAFGPLALACTIAYEQIGVVGLVAFSLPPALLMFSVQQYLDRTRTAVEEVRRANDELRHANEQLAEANDDLHELFRLAGGLAARAHDRTALVGYVEEALERITGTRVTVTPGEASRGVKLVAGGRQVGALEFSPRAGFDGARWDRLRDALLPQLATAVESAELVARVKKTHLDTIAALSRSMEAKDYYTGGHTERVAEIAVALAARLGYSGADLEAVEIGALLHDIGKIGIPEAILQKPGPLDDDEWEVMQRHPVISDYILSEVELHPIVRQIARWSHERIDGMGYPDRLSGAEIPLPARIVLVADAFDALTSDRAYRPGRGTLEALQELRVHAGTQFCPMVIEALEQLHREEPELLRTAKLEVVKVA